ncbi:MAG: hypothetical protein HC905_26525 [Bacteroidales bacterium]|nr:hypothetical protein [Bacteroidales bacterium]
MKKLLYIMLLNAFLLGGCGEDWLVPTNDVNPTLESFYTNEANLVSAVNGVYRQLLNGTGNLYGYRIWAFGDAGADLVDGRNLNYYSANPEAIQRGSQTPGNGFINSLWTDNYNIISTSKCYSLLG